MKCSASRWDCHNHREELKVSQHATVYHPDHGQLSVLEKHWDVNLWHPIMFKDKAAAWKWIQEGYIAELQEGLGNLGVSFTKTSCASRVTPNGRGERPGQKDA